MSRYILSLKIQKFSYDSVTAISFYKPFMLYCTVSLFSGNQYLMFDNHFLSFLAHQKATLNKFDLEAL